MIDNNLFAKYQNVEVNHYGTLFAPDFKEALDKRICAFCFRRLYFNREKTTLRCKSKSCGRFFTKKV